MRPPAFAKSSSATLFVAAALFALAVVIDASDSFTLARGIARQSVTAHGACRKVTNDSPTGKTVYIPTVTAGEWSSFYTNPPAGISLEACAEEIVLSTTTTTYTNLNLCTLAGSPTTPGDYVFTIPAGTIVNSNSTGVAALTTGTCWPAGSNITLVNNGSIYGRGGNGGNAYATGARVYRCNGNPGGAGGPALDVSYPLTIDNTNGLISGGGGGGGSGAAVHTGGWCGLMTAGGGGGQGSADSSGGSGSQYGGAGGTGTVSGPGGGGAGYSAGGSRACKTDGGSGGVAGSAGTYPGSCCYAASCASGGAGGAGGAAIIGSGNGLTWLGGNDATHVKGAVQ